MVFLWKHSIQPYCSTHCSLKVLGSSLCHFFAYADSTTWMKPRALYILLHICLYAYISLLPLNLYSTLLQFESLGSRRHDGARMLRFIWGNACENKRERNKGGQGKPSDPGAGLTPVKGRVGRASACRAALRKYWPAG